MPRQERIKPYKPEESSSQHDYSAEDAVHDRNRDTVKQARAKNAGKLAIEHVAEIDAILDEIDEVLEENAIEIVTTYIQKGGE